MKQLLIIGGGFAGLKAALSAAYEIKENDGDVEITLISDKDFLVIRPRLYQANPADMKVPLQPTLDPIGINFIEGRVSEIDTPGKKVSIGITKHLTTEVSYDRLILAAGSVMQTLPVPDLEKHSWNIDSYEAALAFDDHLLKVARLPKLPGHNRFVIVGGGMTGIELATELRGRIRNHADQATADAAEIFLIDQAQSIGPSPAEPTAEIFDQALENAKVTVMLGRTLTGITPTSVTLDNGEEIETASVVITAGMRANPLADLLSGDQDQFGRLKVDSSLKVTETTDIYAAGDIASAHIDADNLALMSCQHAMPMGAHAGYNAARELMALPPRAYEQPNYVNCIDLGESGALLTKGWERELAMSGPEAKDLKRKINENFIYPPSGDAAEILAKAHIDSSWGDR